MKRIATALAACVLLATTARAQVANTNEIPARIELHPVQSLWITDQQFLTGDDKGRQVTVAAALRLPQRAGKVPAVILMHGSGGIGGNVPFWERELNAQGIATMSIDGMTGRGLQGVGANQAILGRLNFIIDIYRSLEILAKHPRIDRDRIALMGFSRGGQAALYASVSRFHTMWNKSGADFSAYIPFYPDCATTYQGDTEIVGKPVRIFHGTPDNYNPVASCKAYAGRLREARRDVELTEYPDAPHGFDNPIAPAKAVPAKDNQSVRDCTIRETNGGVLVNVATQAPFTYQDACVRLDPLVGSDAAAIAAVRVAVRDFLKATLKPE